MPHITAIEDNSMIKGEVENFFEGPLEGHFQVKTAEKQKQVIVKENI